MDYKETKALIPEFYYDLIGRIAPGSLLVIQLAWPLRTEISNFDSDLMVMGAAVMLAYTFGLVLDIVGALATWMVGLLFRAVLRRVGTKPEGNFSRIMLMNTHISSSSKILERQRHVVGKMSAERAALRSLAVIWGFSACIGLPPINELTPAIRGSVFGILCATVLFATYFTRMKFYNVFMQPPRE